MLTGNKNKGEWSEFYVLLKLIDEPVLHLANDDLEIDWNAIIPVSKATLHQIRNGIPTQYVFPSEADPSLRILSAAGERSVVISKPELKKHIRELLESISNAPKKSGSFAIPASDLIMNMIGLEQVKAGSQKKADIILDIIDRGQARCDVGFSIKSMLGGLATLFNTSVKSNIIYEVAGYRGATEEVNSISDRAYKYRKRVAKISENGGLINFDRMHSDVFLGNLKFIDSSFPEMLASMVRNYYQGKGGVIKEAVRVYSEETGTSEELVSFKMKQFLLNAALGMTPAKPWDGYMNAEGGYLIVKENGDIACYQAYSRDKFADYLYNNTKIDTPSGGRHKFGILTQEGAKQYISLNFQIRFLN